MSEVIEIRIRRTYERCKDPDGVRQRLYRAMREESRLHKLAFTFDDVNVSHPELVAPKKYLYRAVIRYKARPDRLTSLEKDEPVLRAVVLRVCATMDWVLEGENPSSSQRVDVIAVAEALSNDFPWIASAMVEVLTTKLSLHELETLQAELGTAAEKIRIKVFEELKPLSHVQRDVIILKACMPYSIRTESRDAPPIIDVPPAPEQEAEPPSSPSEANPATYPAIKKLLGLGETGPAGQQGSLDPNQNAGPETFRELQPNAEDEVNRRGTTAMRKLIRQAIIVYAAVAVWAILQYTIVGGL